MQEEDQYLTLVTNIIEHGELRQDRTNTGTISIFAPTQLKFSLESNFPLLTTKRVPMRIVFEELMFFIKGQTDGALLKAKNVKIWEGNGSRGYLDSIGLTDRQEDDLGPIYGFQWRHFGASYIDCYQDYSGQGVDQLREVLQKLIFNPMDRRIILTAWNPKDLSSMALPPCHMFCQFYVSTLVDKRPKLSCQMYQRSCDMGLGVPFNIASYSLLMVLIATILDYDLGHFSYCMGDAHVYLNHVDALKIQIQRKPRPFPTLTILKKSTLKDMMNDQMSQHMILDALILELESFTFEDLIINNYDPFSAIKMTMAV